MTNKKVSTRIFLQYIVQKKESSYNKPGKKTKRKKKTYKILTNNQLTTHKSVSNNFEQTCTTKYWKY